ncbi:ninjurin-B-like isoform X1 [Daphnia carinata]|uniref:ninjurin-B-like isoform X1 n=1 Tax=Daphnia carinata TaxID=120202 RepID=UPI00257F840A|nr:ninjurin-B-like isoform X1 [Daphnia carinata]
MADSTGEDIQETTAVQQATENDSLEQDAPIEETQDRSHVVQKSKWTDCFRHLFSSGRRRNLEQVVCESRDTRQPGEASSNETEGPNEANNLAGQHADYSVLSGVFNSKKTLANGLVDFAFLTANANQLHNAVNSTYTEGPERLISIVLISISLILQLVTGVLLIIGSYIKSKSMAVKDLEQSNSSPANVAAQRRLHWLNKIDHLTLALVFFIAIINVFIAAFATPQSSSPSSPNNTAS